MQRLIIGNWKMNLNPGEASLLVHRLQAKIEPNDNTEVVVCPPYIDLYPLVKDIDRTKLKIGAQNIHYRDHGPYTGEISAAMLNGLVQYAIVGHSERRAMGEDDRVIAKKVAAALRNDIIPILCIGETLSDRQHDLSTKVVIDQLTAGLSEVTAEDVSRMVIAYEPVWSIGTAVPATPDQIRPCVRAIQSTIEDLYGEAASGVRILYGGSVSSDLVGGILKVKGLAGLLVGGNSLNYEDFAQIIKNTQDL